MSLGTIINTFLGRFSPRDESRHELAAHSITCREPSLTGREVSGQQVLDLLQSLQSQPEDLKNPKYLMENTPPSDWIRVGSMLVSQGESREIAFHTKGMVNNSIQEIEIDSWRERVGDSSDQTRWRRERFYFCDDNFRGYSNDPEIKIGNNVYRLEDRSILTDQKGKFAGTWTLLNEFSLETLEWRNRGLLIALYGP